MKDFFYSHSTTKGCSCGPITLLKKKQTNQTIVVVVNVFHWYQGKSVSVPLSLVHLIFDG